MHTSDADEVIRFAASTLLVEDDDARNQVALLLAERSGGDLLWAELVLNILNAAVIESATAELLCLAIEQIPTSRPELYEWMLQVLDDDERAEALVLFQWAILAAEPLRLNDLRVAVGLAQDWDLDDFTPYKALVLASPSRLARLKKPRNSYSATHMPEQFHRWILNRSVGLLDLMQDGDQGSAAQPLGLQRVLPIHKSVREFFLCGRGFACLMAGRVPESYRAGDIMDVLHYSMLHSCLTYLNMRDFDHLGQANLAEDADEPEKTKFRRRHVEGQRRLIMASYPFLGYAVDNLLYHLLSPRLFRYFLPQRDILAMFSADDHRLWRRWTCWQGSEDASTIFEKQCEGNKPMQFLLSPVFGARFRLERVFRKLSRQKQPPLCEKPRAEDGMVTILIGRG